MRSMPNSNTIIMNLRMRDPHGQVLAIRSNQDSMTISLRRLGTDDPILITYEEADELMGHLNHLVHGVGFVPPVEVERHLDELDEIDVTLGDSK